MKKVPALIFLMLISGLILIVLYFSQIAIFKISDEKKTELFTVGLKLTEPEIVQNLVRNNLVRYSWTIDLILTLKGKHNKIEAGGYFLSKNMDLWQMVNKLTSTPDLKWVVIPEGLRKEQIGERLAKTLNWNQNELDQWNNVYTRMKFDYIEGVYFPDTYLIPVSESGLDISQRMIDHFNEKFAPYFDKFANKDILWTTGLKVASLIQRETANKNDMPLISGVIWNRLLQPMVLQIDATVQYAKGKEGDSWWSQVTPEDIKTIDSPYNTYLYKGLPPHPICNPGLDAIEAALNPAETDCLFYLHDRNAVMHCSKTYQEHLENVKKYLN